MPINLSEIRLEIEMKTKLQIISRLFCVSHIENIFLEVKSKTQLMALDCSKK